MRKYRRRRYEVLEAVVTQSALWWMLTAMEKVVAAEAARCSAR
jgi:hypothetical protein